jgi:ribonucleotide monophosphatase NagD (HAD superfamily)
VLWVGDKPIPGAKELIALLHSLGKRVVFVVRSGRRAIQVVLRVH